MKTILLFFFIFTCMRMHDYAAETSKKNRNKINKCKSERITRWWHTNTCIQFMNNEQYEKKGEKERKKIFV